MQPVFFDWNETHSLDEQDRVLLIMHYLDYFHTLGPPEFPTCLCNPETVKGVYQHLGILLALKKMEGPSQSLTHLLGTKMDINNMEACLLLEKTSVNL